MAADHFSRQAAEYAKFRPDYPEALFDWLAGHVPAHELAWDVGCGNGQASVPLASRFARVVATDRSLAQIDQASRHRNIEYHTAPCENSGLMEATCDIVTVGQAIHWFNFDNFYTEVRRVLKPGALLAAWTYTLLRGEPAINAVIERFYVDVLGPWWPPERRWVEAGYVGMPFPFEKLTTPEFEIRRQWTLNDLTNYIGTWSAVERCRENTGSDPTLELFDRLRPHWGSSPDTLREIIWPIAMVAGCKESAQ